MNKILKLGGRERTALNLVGVPVILCLMGPACPNYILSLETYLCATPYRSDVNLACDTLDKKLFGYLLLLGFHVALCFYPLILLLVMHGAPTFLLLKVFIG